MDYPNQGKIIDKKEREQAKNFLITFAIIIKILI